MGDARQQGYERWQGYTRLDRLGKSPRFDFGCGLSYTEFEYDNLYCRFEADTLNTYVTVRNIGKRESDHSVLMFVGAPGVVVQREKRLLKGFTRIHLMPGEEKEVCISCPLQELAYYDEQLQAEQLEAGEYTVMVEGLSCRIRIENKLKPQL